MEQRYKYPRTGYLPWSPSVDSGRVVDTDIFRGKKVVVTEKMDGENITMYRDGLHARSIDSAHHPSRSWIKGYHAGVAHRIPRGWRLVGEYMYARHSIPYNDLDSYFYLLSVWDNRNICLNVARTKMFASELGMPMPEILYWDIWDEEAIRAIKVDTGLSEGYVVRNSFQFHYDDFSKNVAKWVRDDHVQTDVHWSRDWEPNRLVNSYER